MIKEIGKKFPSPIRKGVCTPGSSRRSRRRPSAFSSSWGWICVAGESPKSFPCLLPARGVGNAPGEIGKDGCPAPIPLSGLTRRLCRVRRAESRSLWHSSTSCMVCVLPLLPRAKKAPGLLRAAPDSEKHFAKRFPDGDAITCEESFKTASRGCVEKKFRFFL